MGSLPFLGPSCPPSSTSTPSSSPNSPKAIEDASKSLDTGFLPLKTILATEDTPWTPFIVLGCVSTVGGLIAVIKFTNGITHSALRLSNHTPHDDDPSDSDSDDGAAGPVPAFHDPVLGVADGQEPGPPPPAVAVAADQNRRPWNYWTLTALATLASIPVAAIKYFYFKTLASRSWNKFFVIRGIQVGFALAIELYLVPLHHASSIVHGIVFVCALIRNKMGWSQAIRTLDLLLTAINVVSAVTTIVLFTLCRSFRHWIIRFNISKVVIEVLILATLIAMKIYL
ncbi:hypothetical protein B0H19DRAFT_1375567 [Mycena capillaripes]|nr:hypothetical protein B0H19DRAFT_1375567 [Mycena capillaripes]